MKIENLKDLLVHELKDLYSAETQILEALPKMAEAAHSQELKKAFNDHLEETKGQKKRLEEIFKHFDYKPGGQKCDAAEGLIEEGEEIIEELEKGELRDAALIGAAQRVEHYEMAGYEESELVKLSITPTRTVSVSAVPVAVLKETMVSPT